MGVGNVTYTRSTAFIGILKQLFLVAVASIIFSLAITAIDYLNKLIGIPELEKSISKLSGTLFALPLMLFTLVALNNAFDLFYLILTGHQFNAAGEELRSVKILVLAASFVGSMALGVVLWVNGGSYLEKRMGLHKEQKEYFSYLDQGCDAWNSYITAGPQHNIDFSYTDLSNRNFNGFFFKYVTFKYANLTGTVFEDCNLQSAWFEGAICQKTSFKESYLRMADFTEADLTDASLEGAYGEKEDFKRANIDLRELEKLRSPVDSRWHNSSWQDYHSPEWLREKGYYIESKPTAESQF